MTTKKRKPKAPACDCETGSGVHLSFCAFEEWRRLGESKPKRKTEAPKVGPNLPVWAWKVKGGTGLWHIGFGPAPSSGVDSFEYAPTNPRADAVVTTSLARAEAWRKYSDAAGAGKDPDNRLWKKWVRATLAHAAAVEALERDG